MAHRKFLKISVFIFVFFLGLPAFAGYQMGRPPPGWNPGNPASYKPAAGEFFDLDKQAWMTLQKVNLGTREITVPSRLPLRPTLEVGLAVATAFSSNPAILVATAAFALYNYYLRQKNITAQPDGKFKQVGESLECPSGYTFDGTQCTGYYSSIERGIFPSPDAAASDFFSSMSNENYVYQLSSCSGTTCTANKVRTTTGLVVDTYTFIVTTTHTGRISSGTELVISPQSVATQMSPYKLPADLANSLPYSMPVTSPIFNPDPLGSPQPMRVPMGEPVRYPNPQYDPATNPIPYIWKTPVVDILPAPTPYDPWRTDIQPKDVVKTDATPVPETSTPPVEPSPGTETPSQAAPGLCDQYPSIIACKTAFPKLCEENPGILACKTELPKFCETNPEHISCKELDTPEDQNLDPINKNVSITPDGGWGGGGSCPQTKTITVQGRTIPIPLDLICQYMQGLRPIIISMAWLSAGFILLGARGGD